MFIGNRQDGASKMADYFHLIVIGHHLEAKCDVANALIKDKTTFRQFACRLRLRVKKFGGKETLSGFKYVAVLTPNLNTPAWTHLTSEIKSKYNHKAFLYVKDYDKVQINHDESIAKIKRGFPNVNVHTIDYMVAERSVGAASFNQSMDFSQKVKAAKAALIKISQDFAKKLNIPYEDTQEVDGRRRGETSIKSDTHHEIPEINIATPDVHVRVKPEPITIKLPEKLVAKDWENFTKTLKYGKANSNHVRVNIVGNQSAGKTTLVKLLQELEVTCPDTKQLPTEALDVTEITSRCSEVDGRKRWETNLQGYEDELNVQRMTEAMKFTIDSGHNIADELSYNDETDYMFSSTTLDEEVTYDTDSHPFSNMARKDNRDLYLKKIIGRLNANATEYMYLSYWDFAGQTTYYSAHQAFLSHSAVYILVVDLSLKFEERLANTLKFRCSFAPEYSVAESILFWVTSIKAFATDSKGGTSPILIVGTHKDKLEHQNGDKLEEIINEKFDKIKDIIRMSDVECIAVNNTCPDTEDLQAIRDRVLELGLGVIHESIPAQWIDLERKLLEQKNIRLPLLFFDDLHALDNGLDLPIRDNDRLEAFLEHQHCRGQLMHFPIKELNNIIFLQPEILAKFLNVLMRAPNKRQTKGVANATKIHNRNGIINSAYIEEALTRIDAPYLSKYVKYIIEILIFLSIIHPYPTEHEEMRYLMPCLLPKRPESEKLPKRPEPENRRVFQIEFPNDNTSSTFFHYLLASLLNEWKPVEPHIGQPEIFNLYACFRLTSDTQHMEVKWEKAHILIDINNFSTKKKMADIDLWGIIEVVKRHIANIFRLYRHTATEYKVKVQCPEHKENFVSFQDLKQEGEAMCYDKIERHAVNVEDVLNTHDNDEKHQLLLKRMPTVRDLGRIAMDLKDSASILATRIRLFFGNVEADTTAMATKDLNYRRFLILNKWLKSTNYAKLGVLLELITETGDYKKDVLIEHLTAQPTKNKYDIADTKLDSVPDNNCGLIAVSECDGKEYRFLSLELGQSFEMIEQYEYNYHVLGLTAIVRELLSSWRKDNPEVSSTRVLLDTAKFVGGKYGSS